MSQRTFYKIGDTVEFVDDLHNINKTKSLISEIVDILKENFDGPFFVYSIYPRKIRIGVCDCFTNEPLKIEKHKLRCGKFMSGKAIEIKTADGEIVSWNGQTYFSCSFVRSTSCTGHTT